ncbi:MAG: energy transducer TonB, partial [Gammaproteobacteria bacterium]|nr:energy transducer TonB [Gammaproteobacteria bacterium]
TPAPAQAGVLKLLKPVHPAYPMNARLSGQEGWVDVVFTVGADGRVGDLRVDAASPPGLFDQAAMAAMRNARYEALPKNQAQVARNAKLRLKFQLDK